jgi:hypothetical protein
MYKKILTNNKKHQPKQKSYDTSNKDYPNDKYDGYDLKDIPDGESGF